MRPISAGFMEALDPRLHGDDSNAGSTIGRMKNAIALALMLLYAAALVWSAWMKLVPWWTLAASLLLNVSAFVMYWKDKYAAEKRQWRVKEDTLHLWSLLGGWGGAWFAQQVLRHKSRKASFLQVYWFTVMAHCAAVGWWLYRA